MKKLIVLLIMLFCISARAADTKVSDLDLNVTPDVSDRLYVVDDPNGTPASEAITLGSLFYLMDTSAELLAILGDETGTGALMFATSPTITTALSLGADDAIAHLTIHDAGTIIFYDDSDDTSVTLGPVANGTTTLGMTGKLDVTGDIESNGTITATTGAFIAVTAGSIDATGAVDIDLGSEDITDFTVTTDGGVSIIDGSYQFPDANGSPSAVGEFQYDNTVTGLLDGALCWYDDDAVRYLVDLATLPVDDDYVVAYDADADGWYMKADADSGGAPEGTAVLSTGEEGATKYLREDGDGTCSWQTPAGGGDLLANGTVPLTAGWDVGAYTITALTFVSDQATGTAPFTVASETEVANLKAATATLAATATVATTVTITDNEDTAENNPIVFVAGADPDGGDLGLESDGTTYYTPSTGTITATEFVGGGAGLTAIDAATGDSATDFFDAGEIADARISDTLTSSTCTGTAAVGTTVTAEDESTDTTCFPAFVTAATGNLGVKTGTNLTFDSATGTLGATILTTATNIKATPRHMIFNIVNPLATQTEDNEICLWPVTPAALTVTKIVVTLDAAANEVAGDLKYADTFIGLANPVVINVFDTSSGVLSDDSITSGAVAAGKCIYIAFDSAPNTAIKQMCVDITFDYD